MIIKETDGFYIHKESNFYIAHKRWFYKANINFSIKWFRKYRENLTAIIKNRDDKNREKNI